MPWSIISGNLFRLLPAVDWIVATAYWLVLAINCLTSCRESRTLPLVLSQEPGGRNTQCPFWGIFTGCQSDSGSRSRQPFWFTSVNTAWLCSTYKPNANQLSAHCSHHLWSVSLSLLAVPCTRTNYGYRSFAVYWPRVWNSLRYRHCQQQTRLDGYSDRWWWWKWFTTFCVSRRRCKMYCGHSRLSVCPQPYAHTTARTRM